MKSKIKKSLFSNRYLFKVYCTIVRILRAIPGIFYLNGAMRLIRVLGLKKKIDTKFNELLNGAIPIEEGILENFKESFKKYIWCQPGRGEIINSFVEADIKMKKESFNMKELETYDVLLICIVKNDLLRMKLFMDHYRKIGVSKFIIIDNMSDDGTYEFLKEQPDVNLYTCNTTYSTLNREAWINRIIAYYGINRWYLCVDSDELFTYPEMERKKITEFIKNQKTKRIRSIMLDMYSSEGIWNCSNIKSEEIMKKYCYFDSDFYIERPNIKFELILGGPRTRVFSKRNNEFSGIMVKHPLFFFEKGDIQGHSHYQFPYKYNYNLKCETALLHYKFLPNDLNKYKQRAESESYANGSKEYKVYISSYKENPSETFMYKGSKEFGTSSVLKEIKIKNIIK